VSQLFREAIGASQAQYDVLLTHLSLIRDLVRLGHHAESFDELCAEAARAVVSDLGYERVAVIVTRDGGDLAVAGSFSQAERFGAAPGPVPSVLLTLARDVVAERSLLRWGGEGVGVRRPLPPQIEGSLIGFPLVVGGEHVGAVMCVHVLTVVWDLTSQRALELVGEIVSQVLTLAQVRLSMTAIQRGLEVELGSSRTRLTRQDHTLREQSERIAGLATSLIASNQAKKTFLALMSHELRTPLSVILGFGSILRDGLVGELNGQQAEYMDRIQTNARHLHQLVEDMLFFVDAETAAIKPAWSDVALAELVEEVATAVPQRAEADAPELVVAIAPAAAVVRSDAVLLRRVLFHVLGNAFKFTPRGRVTVEAECLPGDAGVALRVTDTGVGIAPDQSRRIFELFRQGDDTHTRKHDGVGLGLNLVRVCLGLLHGRLHIGPGPTGGTRVEIRLPRVAESTQAEPASDDRETGRPAHAARG